MYILTADLLLVADSDKRQNRPLAPYGQETRINIWSRAPDGARHQDGLTNRQSPWDSDSDCETPKNDVLCIQGATQML
jgi:hypothetical protein